MAMNGFSYSDIKEMPYRVINSIISAIGEVENESMKSNLVLNAIASQGDGDTIKKTLKDFDSNYNKYEIQKTASDEIAKLENLMKKTERK